MIDFPTSPAVDTVVTAPNGTKWKWNGTVWELTTSPGSGGASAVTYDWANSHTLLQRTTDVALSASSLAIYDVVWESAVSPLNPDAWVNFASGATSVATCPETGLYWFGMRAVGTFDAGVSWLMTYSGGSSIPLDYDSLTAAPSVTAGSSGSTGSKRGGTMYVSAGTVLKVRFVCDTTGGPVNGALDAAELQIVRLR